MKIKFMKWRWQETTTSTASGVQKYSEMLKRVKKISKLTAVDLFVNPIRTKISNIYSQEEINLYCIIKLAT